MNSTYRIRNKWCKQIPLLHQILTSTCPEADFPDPSRVFELDDACAIWEALHYTMKSLLGWQNPAKGLAWWYQQGKPTADSDLLKMTTRLWGQGNAVDYYAAWTWSTSDPEGGKLDTRAEFPDDAWWTAFRNRPEPAWNDPYSGGYNPLHLGHSQVEPFGEIEGNLELTQNWELFHDEVTRRAVLIVDHISVWRNALNEADGRLPDLGDRSWHVQIFDRQYGGLGTFRKSRVTGHWFQGKHSIHMKGNPIPDGST